MRVVWITVLGMLAFRSPAAREFRIHPDGTGDFPTIMAGVRAASPGDTLLLASGRYSGDGNTNLDLSARRLVVRGAAIDPDACIIDCQHAGRAVLVRSSNPDSSTFIGLTFTGGSADEGGAALIDGNAKTRFVACAFRENEATKGGALSLKGSRARFDDCLFVGNAAAERGGAVYEWSCSDAQFVNCTFVDNAAPSGSAMSCVGVSTLSLTRCLIAFNTPGEAIQCRDRSSGSCTPRIESTNIHGNGGGDWRGCLDGLESSSCNMSRDPLFLEPRGADYRLAPDSPCRAIGGMIGVPERR